MLSEKTLTLTLIVAIVKIVKNVSLMALLQYLLYNLRFSTPTPLKREKNYLAFNLWEKQKKYIRIVALK